MNNQFIKSVKKNENSENLSKRQGKINDNQKYFTELEETNDYLNNRDYELAESVYLNFPKMLNSYQFHNSGYTEESNRYNKAAEKGNSDSLYYIGY
jgi:hypothetical protein